MLPHVEDVGPGRHKKTGAARKKEGNLLPRSFLLVSLDASKWAGSGASRAAASSTTVRAWGVMELAACDSVDPATCSHPEAQGLTSDAEPLCWRISRFAAVDGSPKTIPTDSAKSWLQVCNLD
ncbi:unnamed protein product, partial [Prorocentrum cordatum]